MDHLFRSLMFVPAHNDRLMNSAARVNADVLLLDIEDSVQPASNKQVARDNILRYIADGTFRGRVLYPRVVDAGIEYAPASTTEKAASCCATYTN